MYFLSISCKIRLEKWADYVQKVKCEKSFPLSMLNRCFFSGSCGRPVIPLPRDLTERAVK